MEYTIIRSQRKTLAIQVNADTSVTVRAPKRASLVEIQKILFEKKDWIDKHIEKLKKQKEQDNIQKIEPLSNLQIRKLASKALVYIPQRVRHFSKLVGVDYGKITVRNQRTRWGSCSSRGNLNFNCLLMLTPPEVIDYVVVHELCHRKEMNHSKAFWGEVEKILPDYKTQVSWLKNNGSQIMRRMDGSGAGLGWGNESGRRMGY